MSNQHLPPAFVDQMKGLLSEDFGAFEAALASATPVSIRLNPGKISGEKLSYLPLDEKVAWHPDAYYLSERPNFTLDPLFHAGAYYVQEASSMFLYEVLEQSAGRRRPLRILDLCAAPGGKTTLIASWMPEGSILVANEVIKSRVSVLRQNLARWGHPGVFACSYDPEAFLPLAGWFDLVVADAPCSGEGLFRKNESSHLEWSPENVALCASRQRRILTVAQKLVTFRGTLVYSTCTYNLKENDSNSRWLADEKEMLPLPVASPAEWGIAKRDPGCQLYPHRLKGEGFYIAAFRQAGQETSPEKRARDFRKFSRLNKKELQIVSEWISEPGEFLFLKNAEGQVFHAPARLERDLLALDYLLPQGVWLHETGQVKGTGFIPSHTLALRPETVSAAVPRIELSKNEALLYLKKELSSLPEAGKGWLLACYQGLGLGWIRNLGSRFNNYFPTEQRIRMDIRDKNV